MTSKREAIRPCRDCSESVHVSEEQVEEILHMMLTRRNRQLVDQETASRRLELCLACDAYHADAGGTCQYCGCLVAVKTRLEGEHCPDPRQPQW